jgi:D-lactate dehydrogenase (cytochrome)
MWITQLQHLLGDRLSTSGPLCDQHAASESHITLGRPEAVAFVRSTQEVADVVAICAAQNVPIVAWGAGTSLEGHALPLSGGLSLDFSQMNAVLELRPEDMLVRVQPGCTREALNRELRATGLFFPVDPGADASLGGMAATRASGTTAVRYGTMRDNVRALEVVLADGCIIRTGSAAPKSSTGYDLTALFVGSEGTLGLITELTLRLHGQPEDVAAAACAFPAVAAAVDAVIETIQSGLPLARIELIDAETARAVNAHAGLDLPHLPHLLVEFHGSPASTAEQAERFGQLAHEHGAVGFEWAASAEARARLWRARHNAYPAILALRPGAKALVTDACVPISRLAEAVTQTAADIATTGLPGPILGHVGDGNFHAILLYDPGDPVEKANAIALSGRLCERALRLGGTVSGEHGIGVGKKGYMEAEHGAGWQVMGTLKRALDPKGILNPGKLAP